MKYRADYCTAAPDWLPNTGYIGDICRVHDRLYAHGGTAKDRARADAMLRAGIWRKAVRAGHAKTGWIVASIYWAAVRAFGWSRFRSLKNGIDA